MICMEFHHSSSGTWSGEENLQTLKSKDAFNEILFQRGVRALVVRPPLGLAYDWHRLHLQGQLGLST